MSDNVSLGEISGYDCGHQSEHCGKTCYVWGLLQFSLENCVWLPVHTTFDAVLLQFCVVQGLVVATSTFMYYAMHMDGALLFMLDCRLVIKLFVFAAWLFAFPLFPHRSKLLTRHRLFRTICHCHPLRLKGESLKRVCLEGFSVLLSSWVIGGWL